MSHPIEPLTKEQADRMLGQMLPKDIHDAICMVYTGQHRVYDTATHVAIPREVYEALVKWSGNEPSQSLLARTVDFWLASQGMSPTPSTRLTQTKERRDE